MVRVPPLAAILDVSRSEAVAEVGLVVQLKYMIPTKRRGSVLQAELEQKRMFPKFGAS